MRILALSDLHSCYHTIFRTISRHQPLDLILLAGDLTHFGPPEKLHDLVGELELIKPGIKTRLVWGNCDPVSEFANLSPWYTENYIGDRVSEEIDYVIAGVDGGLTSFFHTPNEFTEEDYLLRCSQILTHPAWQPNRIRIVLSHFPPYGFLDTVRKNHHVGSRSIMQLLEHTDLFICGHIHEQKGENRHGSCKILNPGPFKDGSYAVLELSENRAITTQFFSATKL